MVMRFKYWPLGPTNDPVPSPSPSRSPVRLLKHWFYLRALALLSNTSEKIFNPLQKKEGSLKSSGPVWFQKMFSETKKVVESPVFRITDLEAAISWVVWGKSHRYNTLEAGKLFYHTRFTILIFPLFFWYAAWNNFHWPRRQQILRILDIYLLIPNEISSIWFLLHKNLKNRRHFLIHSQTKFLVYDSLVVLEVIYHQCRINCSDSNEFQIQLQSLMYDSHKGH